MREELRKYGEDAYEMVKYAANEIGPRLPGSDNETKYHDYMADKLREIGLNPVTEKIRLCAACVNRRSSVRGVGRHHRLRADNHCDYVARHVGICRYGNALCHHRVHAVCVDLACCERF